MPLAEIKEVEILKRLLKLKWNFYKN